MSDIVSGQYEEWVYPAPIKDLPGWLEHNWQWFDPSHAHRLMWPDRDYPHGMDILVAGCGTNQAAVIAHTNPSAQVVGIDVSEASLDHHRWLKQEYALDNLDVHRVPIEDVASLDRDFDLIITTGVLHHMADPAEGMRCLAERLRPDGVLAVMLYATYGRMGVQMMQSAFRDLGLRQDPDSLRIVRDAIDQLGPQHPLMTYLRIASDLSDDAGLVDTFLHGREATYTIDECRDLVHSAGLAFQDVFLKSSYYAPVSTTSEFLTSVAAMPREQQWSIMQRVNSGNACHYFLACRADRPTDSYVVDFDADDPGRFVPSFRKACGISGSVCHRYDWQVELTPLQTAIVERVDGQRSLGDIARDVSASADDPLHVEQECLRVFRALWQWDFLAMGLPSPATRR